MCAYLHVRLLGDFAISLDNKVVATFDSPRLQSLLAYLLLHRNAPQSRRYLAFLFWPESTVGAQGGAGGPRFTQLSCDTQAVSAGERLTFDLRSCPQPSP